MHCAAGQPLGGYRGCGRGGRTGWGCVPRTCCPAQKSLPQRMQAEEQLSAPLCRPLGAAESIHIRSCSSMRSSMCLRLLPRVHSSGALIDPNTPCSPSFVMVPLPLKGLLRMVLVIRCDAGAPNGHFKYLSLPSSACPAFLDSSENSMIASNNERWVRTILFSLTGRK